MGCRYVPIVVDNRKSREPTISNTIASRSRVLGLLQPQPKASAHGWGTLLLSPMWK